jgi:predicted enzyme related to lactoylglutathione lyase
MSVDSFKPISIEILLDGIATHGHPRALIAALAYGYALWKCFRHKRTLEYGQIPEELLNDIQIWSPLPDISSFGNDWFSAACQVNKDYPVTWNNAVKEIKAQLLACIEILRKGSLVADEEALTKFDCFNPRINGSGIVAAIASVFLASRYAPDPIHGVLRAAFALGSDTDTIASMTGGLLGAINGSNWLYPLADAVQDSKYIEQSALHVLQSSETNKPVDQNIKGFNAKSLKVWVSNMFEMPKESKVNLPDGRVGSIDVKPDFSDQNGRFRIQFRKIFTQDGQTIFINNITKSKTQTKPKQGEENQRTKVVSPVIKCAVKIPVRSLERSSWFYRDVLDLSLRKQTTGGVVIENRILLVPSQLTASRFKDKSHICTIYVETPDLKLVYSKVKSGGIKVLTAINTWEGTENLFFRCEDPDGNTVEVFENRRYNIQPQLI